MTPRVPLSDLVDHDMSHYSFSRSSKLPIEYFRRKPLITAERVLIVLVCGVIVWAVLPWGHI